MTFMCLEDNQKTILKRFRKTDSLKALGYKTFLCVESLGIVSYLLEDIASYTDIEKAKLHVIVGANAKAFCTLENK